jgi:trehalose-6-phosphate synthase
MKCTDFNPKRYSMDLIAVALGGKIDVNIIEMQCHRYSNNFYGCCNATQDFENYLKFSGEVDTSLMKLIMEGEELVHDFTSPEVF